MLKKTLVFYLLVLFMSACSENAKETPIEIKVINKIIHLNKELKTLKTEEFENDTVYRREIFEYKKEVVSVSILSKDSSSVEGKVFLSSKGLADSAFAIMYEKNKKSPKQVLFKEFIYDKDGFPRQAIMLYTDSTDQIARLLNVVENGNIVQSFIVVGNSSPMMSIEYEFYDLKNKLGLDMSEFFCAKNVNLIKTKKVSSNLDFVNLFSEPSITNYEYKLDSNGFIIEKQETKVSSSINLMKKTTIEKTITKYSYIFK